MNVNDGCANSSLCVFRAAKQIIYVIALSLKNPDYMVRSGLAATGDGTRRCHSRTTDDPLAAGSQPHNDIT